jgi:hypothetical protein
MNTIKICNLTQFYAIMLDDNREYDAIIKESNKNVLIKQDDDKIIAVYDKNLNPPEITKKII